MNKTKKHNNTKKELIKNDPSLASTPAEIMKWEIAKELGFNTHKVLENGWQVPLLQRKSGRIGGILASRQKKSNKTPGY